VQCPGAHVDRRADRAGVPDRLCAEPGPFLAKVCAAAIVVSLPVLIAGFAAQDKLVQGLSLGAVNWRGMTELTAQTLPALRDHVPTPGYDRSALRVGIVHLGGGRVSPSPPGEVR
jgi:hypothetical protein